MAKKKRMPACWRKAMGENPDLLSVGEVCRSVATRQRIQNGSIAYHAEQLPAFAANEVPGCAVQEYQRVKHTYRLQKLMDCKNIEKSSGQHRHQPSKKKETYIPHLDSNMVASWLRSGGVVRYNVKTQARYVLFRGDVMGRVSHYILSDKFFKVYPCTQRRVPGTDEIEFQLVKGKA